MFAHKCIVPVFVLTHLPEAWTSKTGFWQVKIVKEFVWINNKAKIVVHLLVGFVMLLHFHNDVCIILQYIIHIIVMSHYCSRAPDKLRICVFYTMKTSKNACIIRSECTFTHAYCCVSKLSKFGAYLYAVDDNTLCT